MSLATRCPQCETALKISQSAAGKRVRCPKCRHAFQVSSVLFNDAATDVAALTTSMDTKPHGAIVGESQPLPPIVATSKTGSSERRTFGRFELRGILGQGTYGHVYRAFDPTLDRDVALKIPKFQTDQSRAVERFLREAKAAARLRHPNIVAVFESGIVDNDYYIAAEFVAGETLVFGVN